ATTSRISTTAAPTATFVPVPHPVRAPVCPPGRPPESAAGICSVTAYWFSGRSWAGRRWVWWDGSIGPIVTYSRGRCSVTGSAGLQRAAIQRPRCSCSVVNSSSRYPTTSFSSLPPISGTETLTCPSSVSTDSSPSATVSPEPVITPRPPAASARDDPVRRSPLTAL